MIVILEGWSTLQEQRTRCFCSARLRPSQSNSGDRKRGVKPLCVCSIPAPRGARWRRGKERVSNRSIGGRWKRQMRL